MSVILRVVLLGREEEDLGQLLDPEIIPRVGESVFLPEEWVTPFACPQQLTVLKVNHILGMTDHVIVCVCG